MMSNKRFFTFFLLPLFLVFINKASAIQMRHTFTFTGDQGETGSGYFIWDNDTVPNGNPLTLPDIIEGSIIMLGGDTPGGEQTLALADWTAVTLTNTPDFSNNMNFSANNGAMNIVLTGVYSSFTSWESALTFVPGTTTTLAESKPIPLIDPIGLVLLCSLLAISGVGYLRVHPDRWQ